MSEPRAGVFVVGSLNADLLIGVRRRPRPGETVLATDTAERPGGKGANQAVAAARLGGAVAMLGRVGDDEHGAMLTGALRDEGVDAGRVTALPDVPTGRAIITVTPDGENAIIVAAGANARLTAADVRDAAEAIAATPVLVVQLEIGDEAVGAAVDAGARGGGEVVLNLAPARRLPAGVLAQVGVLVVNEHEAGLLLGRPVADAADARRHGPELLALGPRTAVVTLGAAGAVAIAPGGQAEHVPAPRVTAVDTTGAGDAFVGALAVSLGTGAALTEATRAAVAAGSAATLGEGAQSALPRAAQVARLSS